MWWRRPSRGDPRLDDVVELLHGVATMLMEIDAKIERIARMLEDT
jgi:hypothetical protein